MPPNSVYDYDLLSKLAIFKLEDSHLDTFKKFKCKNPLLNNYLYEGAIEEQKNNPAIQTYIAEYKGIIVGFVSVFLSDNLRALDKRQHKKTKQYHPITYQYAALKIGRLAVSEVFTLLGIGTFLAAFSYGLAQQTNKILKKNGANPIYQYLTADSYLNVTGFYNAIGFSPTGELDKSQSNPKDVTELMYLNIANKKTKLYALLENTSKIKSKFKKS